MGGRPRVSVSPQEASRWDPPTVWGAEGGAEVRALGSGRMGISVLARGDFEGHRGLGRPCPFFRPE